jgi:transcriptional regulator with GAF, ATPase, and Fis domain/putative methionine-R-sulfoxide reductase with GAF domain
MTSHWEMRVALAAFEPEARAIAPLHAWGLVLPAGDDRVSYQMSHRWGTHVNILPAADLPAGLRTPISQVRQFAPSRESDNPIDATYATLGVGALAAIPLPGDLGLYWAGSSSREPLTEPQIAAFRSLAERIVGRSREPESADARAERLERLESLRDVLPLIAGALDLRDVFERLSGIARRALPHDTCVVGIHTEDHTQVRLHALSGAASLVGLPEVVPNPYPKALTTSREFAIIRDLAGHPFEHDGVGARLGLRSALRLPLLLDGQLKGVLDFSSVEAGCYSETDLPIARRIADYITLALSHKEIADRARRAATLAERAASLNALEGLLSTLTGVLDVREVVDRVSEIAQTVLKHDAMSIPLAIEGTDRVRIYANSGLGGEPGAYEARNPGQMARRQEWDFQIFDDLANVPADSFERPRNAGMRSVLMISIRRRGRVMGAVNFYSRTLAAFSPEDVPLARRVADHIALSVSHQRLAEEAHHHEELRARAANLELLDELIAELTDTGELPQTFDRVSEIAKKVLPHDLLALPVLLPDGLHARVYATSGPASPFPDVVPIPPVFFTGPDWEFDLIDDLSQVPEQRNLTATKLGYRSALRVPIRLEGRLVAALAFLSFTPAAFTHSDILIARRVADRIALSLSREQGAAALQRADEAAARVSKLESRVRELTDELDARTGYRRVVGETPEWRQVLTQAAQVAATDTTVLLLGDSGTGKEVIARFLHRASARSHGPFVALNCAAMPEQLLESELFGYERGAFTGATQSKPGQIEQAAGGVLFLDEVGEMSSQSQAKFLRVLQEREFQRLGGSRVLRADIRVVAATNRDLRKGMERGTFREDLYYRLNVFEIRLPPLRDRRDDIVPLSEAFIAEIGRSIGRPPAGLSRDAKVALMDYHWPGNVRELRNVLERAAILCDGGLITTEHLALTKSAPRPQGETPAPPTAPVSAPPPEPPAERASATPSGRDLKSVERAMIEKALADARFNKSRAAKSLGLTRAQLYVRMRRHGLE